MKKRSPQPSSTQGRGNVVREFAYAMLSERIKSKGKQDFTHCNVAVSSLEMKNPHSLCEGSEGFY